MTKDAATARPADTRREALERWLDGVVARPYRLAPASADASFRRYFRVTPADGETRIAMDAPPEHEDTRQFLHVAGLMREAGLHVPEVFAADAARGFALLSDLGTRSYLDALGDGDADALFADAIDALVTWQLATRPGALPDYDAALLRRELDLFPDWYARGLLGRPVEGALGERWQEVRAALVREALAQPQVFVHRDFMVRNLMDCEPRPGVIDFQDAVVGPIAYDLLSLFRDAGLSWDEARVAGWVAQYVERARAAGLPVPPRDRFTRMFDLIGVQRHLKVAGIFARLALRDGKRKYLAEIPRILGFLRAVAPRYPETAPLTAVLDGLQADG